MQISHRPARKKGDSLQAVCSISKEKILHFPGKSWFFKSFVSVSDLIVLDWRTSLRRLNSPCTAIPKTLKHSKSPQMDCEAEPQQIVGCTGRILGEQTLLLTTSYEELEHVFGNLHW